MGWSITGWSGGARQPVSYRLRAGQFRGMGTVRGYSNNIFVNNNYYNSGFSGYNYGYGCNCNSNSGTPKWMNWMMGMGMGTSLLGNVLGLFNIGKNKDVEGKGGAETKAKTDVQDQADNNCKKIKALYGDNVASVVYIDGKYNARLKDNTMLTATDSKTLINQINEKIKTTKPTQTTSTPGNEDAEGTGKKPGDGKEEVTAQKPNLFNPDTLKDLTNSEAVLDKFKHETKADAVEINDVKSSQDGITISLLVDKGIKNGDKDVTIKLSQTQLTELANKPNETVNLESIGDKKVVASNIDGYISIKIGNQDYIIGKANDKYQGFQYENMNGEGYNKANWTSKKE